MDFSKKILTLEETAVYTGYSTSYLLKLTSAGIIPHSKPNRKSIFFDREELENWLMSHRKKTRAEMQQEAATYITSQK